MEASISEISSVGANEYKLSYVLRNVRRNMWALHERVPLWFYFWDSNMVPIENNERWNISLTEGFLSGNFEVLAKNEVTIKMPREVAHLAIKMGNTELVTKPIEIPKLTLTRKKPTPRGKPKGASQRGEAKGGKPEGGSQRGHRTFTLDPYSSHFGFPPFSTLMASFASVLFAC
jgi:hypothetical protein